MHVPVQLLYTGISKHVELNNDPAMLRGASGLDAKNQHFFYHGRTSGMAVVSFLSAAIHHQLQVFVRIAWNLEPPKTSRKGTSLISIPITNLLKDLKISEVKIN